MIPIHGNDNSDRLLQPYASVMYWRLPISTLKCLYINHRMSVKDDLMQRDVKLTDEELEIIRRIQMHEIPDKDYNPYEPTVEWFTSKPMVMPLTAAPEPKRRFVPSRWEAKKVEYNFRL